MVKNILLISHWPKQKAHLLQTIQYQLQYRSYKNPFMKNFTIPKFLIGLSTIFLLSGCFSGSNNTNTTADTRFRVYDAQDYSLLVPKDWDTIDKSQFTSQVPAQTDIVFRNNVKNENFTATIAIMRPVLQEPIPTLEYAKMVYNRESSGLYDFKVIRKDPMKIKIGDKEEDTYFLIFEAREAPDGKLVRYIETSGTKGNAAFIAKAGLSSQENENTRQLLEDVIKSFRIK